MTTEQFMDEFKNIMPWLRYGNRRKAITGKRDTGGRPPNAPSKYKCPIKGCEYITSLKVAVKNHLHEVHSY